MRVFGELRNWFLLSLALGSAGVLAGWAFDSVVLTFLVPLGAMAVYLLPAFVIDRTLFHTYVFADSFYFLGFLFTLISLLVSLLAFAGSASSADEITGAVSRFGIALATTVVGLGVRVYLVNFRPELDDDLAQAQAKLAEAGLALRNQLDLLNTGLVVQTDAWTGSLSNAISTANAELQTAYEAGGKAVESASRELAAATEAEAQAVRDSLARLVAEVENSSTSIGTAATSLSTNLASFELSEDVFRSAVNPALARLAEALTLCAESVDTIRIDPSALQESLQSLTAAANTCASEANSVAASFGEVDTEKLAALAAEYGAALATINDSVRSQAQSLKALETGLETDAGLAQAYREQLEGELAAAKSALAEVSRSMVSAANFVVQSLRD